MSQNTDIPFWRAESFAFCEESAGAPNREDPSDPAMAPPSAAGQGLAMYQRGGELIVTALPAAGLSEDPQPETAPTTQNDSPSVAPGSLLTTILFPDGPLEIGKADHGKTQIHPVRNTGADKAGKGRGKEPASIPTDTSGGDVTEIRIGAPGHQGKCPIPTGRGFFVRTHRERHTFGRITKPGWAHAIGRDRFGLWATIALAAEFGTQNAGSNETVVQRLRWIPPGQFLMGSPDSERIGFPRYEQDKWCVRESPRHRVVLTRGYWLFDTPCTQALWQAVMGENPSRFQSPDRPVESVTWNEVGLFLEKINRLIPGLNPTLPSEAQWEYACRAGTRTATYAGPLKLSGSNNAEVLDAIAWYGGNSGLEFELPDACDSTDWREKQYDHKRAGTHPVARKRPNPWGLYDMLGNVWEWCRDGLREYGGETAFDPRGPEALGEERVVRGGSWYYFARYARAAFRLRYRSGVRFDRLGFRCVIP
uniref:Formylglycine-generating enzyme, required for sulfatase activity, contains SUMF1/FGE domain n=1 Tax=Candidatus Kentrum sp. DK TaxID=2126562 RepID=A0A450TB34_9GAMM|nr:MAG: Formylglycine-generating enzyme, required for sulfatase activity, contains SUMF1/FGE domain [Candidatus Kentron sp. DK]